MGRISRRGAWRIVTAPVVVLALFLGWVAFAHRDAKPARPVHVTAQDLLLAATAARKGIYLEYDGITGPPGSNHAVHAPLRSFSFGVTRAIGSPVGGAGREAGSPKVSEIRVTKLSDKYSVPLLNQSLAGTGNKNAIIYFTGLNAAGLPFDYLEIDMTSVLLSSFSFSSGGDVPTESMTFNFTKIVMKAHFAGTSQILTYDLLLQKVG